MSESVNIENIKQNPQKPPISIGRIACEILAAAVAGLAVALPIACITGIVLVDEGSCFAGFGLLAIFACVFPPLYGLGGAVGVYLVGTRGKQTGSFLLTLGGGFLTGLLTLVMISIASYLTDDELISIVFFLLWPFFVLLSPPIVATISFNLTRRYKESPRLKSTTQSQ